MGALVPPESGTVYVDAQVVIYTVEDHPKYAPLLQAFWRAGAAGTIDIVTSELTILESLVAPLRREDRTLEVAYEETLFGAQLGLAPITRDVLREAARLRSMIRSLRTPDAIHAASGQLVSCVLFVSNDRIFRQVPNLPLVLLDDLLEG